MKIVVSTEISGPSGETGVGIELWDGTTFKRATIIKPSPDKTYPFLTKIKHIFKKPKNAEEKLIEERLPEQIAYLVQKWFKEYMLKDAMRKL